MRILIQECLKAKVVIDDVTVGEISNGEVIFVGFTDGDDETVAEKMLGKMMKLRIFADSQGKTNLDIASTGGNVLCISQFTLYADASHGNRPSFTKAMRGEFSKPLFDYFCSKLKEVMPNAQFGVFGADMKVHLINDGPFTILLDSKEVL